MQVDNSRHEHPDALLDRGLRGQLNPAEKAELERHLASCEDCAAEMEAARIFGMATAPDENDDALNRAAVERALAALAKPEPLSARLHQGLRRLLFPATAVLGTAAALAVGMAVYQARRPAEPRPVSDAVARPLLLADGSEIAPIGKTTTFQVTEQTPSNTTVHLSSGSAQFRVRHNNQRRFRVDVGPLVIEDLGTVFRVSREAEGSIRVAVSEGRVAVLYAGSGARTEVGAGEDRVFPATPSSDLTARPAQPTMNLPVTDTVPPVARAPSRARPANDAAELLQAADMARRSGHPKAAVAPLRSLVERFPRDPRAPSAAFTLGWVLLTDLGRAREAAAAFAEAERLAPRGALAEDAAARVAEAWQKAGDLDRAAQAARSYEKAYPSGRYISLMHGLARQK